MKTEILLRAPGPGDLRRSFLELGLTNPGEVLEAIQMGLACYPAGRVLAAREGLRLRATWHRVDGWVELRLLREEEFTHTEVRLESIAPLEALKEVNPRRYLALREARASRLLRHLEALARRFGTDPPRRLPPGRVESGLPAWPSAPVFARDLGRRLGVVAVGRNALLLLEGEGLFLRKEPDWDPLRGRRSDRVQVFDSAGLHLQSVALEGKRPRHLARYLVRTLTLPLSPEERAGRLNRVVPVGGEAWRAFLLGAPGKTITEPLLKASLSRWVQEI